MSTQAAAIGSLVARLRKETLGPMVLAALGLLVASSGEVNVWKGIEYGRPPARWAPAEL